MLMFNEIKIEEIIHYSASDNQIVGVCHEHSGGFALEYSSAHEASQLFKGVKDGKVHIATEVSTHTLGSFLLLIRHWCAWVSIPFQSYLQQLMSNSHITYL